MKSNFFLGNRYGWCPSSFKPELISKYPWLKEITPGEKSVTELEGIQ